MIRDWVMYSVSELLEMSLMKIFWAVWNMPVRQQALN
ncbi:hypothetical protein BMETH_2281_0 [methanotrophic bacterial endosymbiont of Bathymodiolus sp.]|nr:hypothetical protein BMETH_2281_0 [methanotrophic bacterial endosymbiont of Bathymodiolus sp.]